MSNSDKPIPVTGKPSPKARPVSHARRRAELAAAQARQDRARIDAELDRRLNLVTAEGAAELRAMVYGND